MKGKLIMRKSLNGIVVFVSFLIFLVSVENAFSAVTERYVYKDDSQYYLSLNEDGTFFVNDPEGRAHGKYILNEQELILIFEGKYIVRGKINGNGFVDPDGAQWVKQSQETGPIYPLQTDAPEDIPSQETGSIYPLQTDAPQNIPSTCFRQCKIMNSGNVKL